MSTTKKLFMDALSDCQSFPGGNLVSIHNSIVSWAVFSASQYNLNNFQDNKALAFSVTSSDPKWIGLICTETSSPCNWTDYSSDTSSYSNFVAGKSWKSWKQRTSEFLFQETQIWMSEITCTCWYQEVQLEDGYLQINTHSWSIFVKFHFTVRPRNLEKT